MANKIVIHINIKIKYKIINLIKIENKLENLI